MGLGRRRAAEGGMGPLCIVEIDPLADDPFGPEAVRQLVQVDRLVFERAPQPLDEADIPQMTSKTVEIVLPFHRPGNGIPFAAIRWPDFGDRPSSGRQFGQIFRHSDTPLLSSSPGHRFSRPTPERVFAVDHRSGSGFSGIGPSISPPRPVGT